MTSYLSYPVCLNLLFAYPVVVVFVVVGWWVVLVQWVVAVCCVGMIVDVFQHVMGDTIAWCVVCEMAWCMGCKIV